MKESKLANMSVDIVELFENFLDSKDIYIPCTDDEEEKRRKEEEQVVKLFGTEYWNLIDGVEAIVRNYLNEKEKVAHD